MLGATPAEVDAKFASTIWHNLSGPWAAKRLAGLSDFEMAELARDYQRTTGDAAMLESLLQTYAPGQLARYRTAAEAAYHGAVLDGPPTTTIDNTISEIYLDFRTAPVGSMGVRAALLETSIYTMSYLAGAWGVGYTIGSGIHWAIETFDPALDDTIGGTVDAALTNIAEATNDVAWGDYKNELNNRCTDFPIDEAELPGDGGSLSYMKPWSF